MSIPAFIEGDIKRVEESLKSAMEACIKHFEKELITIRTGRASVDVLDSVRVDYYGQMLGLRELATVAAPDARLLTIQPWDKGAIAAIEKAIMASDLGLTPVNDGTVIRLQLPMMSSERRDELVKVLNKKTEECRIQIRNVRRDHLTAAKDAEKKKDISEDFGKRLADVIQKVTDLYIEQAHQRAAKKEAAIKEV